MPPVVHTKGNMLTCFLISCITTLNLLALFCTALLDYSHHYAAPVAFFTGFIHTKYGAAMRLVCLYKRCSDLWKHSRPSTSIQLSCLLQQHSNNSCGPSNNNGHRRISHRLCATWSHTAHHMPHATCHRPLAARGGAQKRIKYTTSANFFLPCGC